MKKIISVIYCGLLILAITGCTETSKGDKSESSLSSVIPANASVNAGWGGKMCEANNCIYYVSGLNSKYRINRMKRDGSNTSPVTGEYCSIGGLTTDNSNLYFTVSLETNDTEILYSLPLNGGKEKKIAEGHIFNLQYMSGRLYWEDYNSPSGEIKKGQTTTIQIKSINPNGSNLQSLFTVSAPAEDSVNLNFLTTEDGLYYIVSEHDGKQCNLYHMDLSGNNKLKINHSKLKDVDQLFYDKGNLYFLERHFNDFANDGSDAMWDSVETINNKGRIKTILNKIGYFPQDFSCIAYCGISNGVFYYLKITTSDSNSEHLMMDFHQYDIDKKEDIILLHNVNMGDKSVGTIFSLRGKKIKNSGTTGMYILGNDVYFSPPFLP